MNVKLHDVISSLTGVSGLAVMRAILDGERGPDRLLQLCDIQIRRAKADCVKEALRGTWADEHLFALRQAVQSWEHYQQQIAECDRQIQALLPEPRDDQPQGGGSTPGKTHKRPGVNAPDIGQLRNILT